MQDHTSPVARWFIRISAGWIAFGLAQLAVLYVGAHVNVAQVGPRMFIGLLLQIAASAMVIIAFYMVHDFIVAKRGNVPPMRGTSSTRSSVVVAIIVGGILGGILGSFELPKL